MSAERILPTIRKADLTLVSINGVSTTVPTDCIELLKEDLNTVTFEVISPKPVFLKQGGKYSLASEEKINRLNR